MLGRRTHRLILNSMVVPINQSLHLGLLNG
uniref:Uncharacterized protein n=1 Tax=Rhizophora mucronata TaxID=61149 RepID=A0A2P2PEE0_RHIMU